MSRLSRMKVEEIDLAQYFNAKLDFLAYSMQGTQKLLYYDVRNRICELKYQSLRNQLAIATNHPEIAGAILTEKQGVYGMVAGEVLYFYECKPVFVERRTRMVYVAIYEEISKRRGNNTMFRHGTTIVSSRRGLLD